MAVEAACRHCGKLQQVAAGLKDWFCNACEHWQDTIACPTCGQPTRISLMPAAEVPEAHEPEPEPAAEPEPAQEGST